MQTSEKPGLIGKILAFAAAAVLLAASLMFSLLLFAAALVAGLLIWGWLWWQTRELRRQMREQPGEGMAGPPPGGRVIEGEVIRDETDDAARR
ncbi:MAG: hypothetical protein R3E35_04815 [Rhodocyclaceae bacterium]